MCVSSDTRPIVRLPLKETSLDAPEMARKAAGDPEQLLPRVAAPVAQALADRYPSLSPAARAALVAALPHASLAPPMAVFDEAAKAETDPDIIPIVLSTRVTSAEDPALARTAASDSPSLRELATLIGDRLRSDERIFARLKVSDLARTAPAPNAQQASGAAPEPPK
jgi:hypothetical protein